MAFIGIDNCVEVSIRSFLALPSSKSGIAVSRAELNAISGSFPKLLELLVTRAPDRFSGLDTVDIEYYHRIRNTLYHEGTGLSVDEQYLLASSVGARGETPATFERRCIPPERRCSSVSYGPICSLVAPCLSRAPHRTCSTSTMKPPAPQPSLEMLIRSWNRIEKLVKTTLDNAGFTSTFKWEEAFAAGLLSPADVANLTELRIARNRLVHSDMIDAEEVAFWIRKSAQILKKLEQLPTA